MQQRPEARAQGALKSVPWVITRAAAVWGVQGKAEGVKARVVLTSNGGRHMLNASLFEGFKCQVRTLTLCSALRPLRS